MSRYARSGEPTSVETSRRGEEGGRASSPQRQWGGPCPGAREAAVAPPSGWCRSQRLPAVTEVPAAVPFCLHTTLHCLARAPVLSQSCEGLSVF